MKNRVLKTLGIGAVCAISALTLFGCGQPADTADATQETTLSSENDNPNFTSDEYDTYLSDDGTSATVIENDDDETSSTSDSTSTSGLDANVIDITDLDDSDSSQTNVFETTPTTSIEESVPSNDDVSIDVTSSNPE